jgi:large subunit ribosomal protein L21
MYAVIRTGGKQYRVAPGDVIKVEKLAPAEGTGNFEFNDVLAASSDDGKISGPGDVKVSARVLGEGRGDKILVFHYKRKKQYKKLQGHRQPFTQVQITEINVGGQSFKADAAKLKQPAKPKAEKTAEAAAKPAKKATRKTATAKSKAAAPKKATAKKSAPKKK